MSAHLVGPQPGEITIELSSVPYRDIVFPPTQSTLRGRVDMSRLNGAVVAPEGINVQSIGEIPGVYISLNVAERRGRIYDPLSLDRERMERVSNWHASIGAGKAKPVPTSEFHLSHDDVATWIHFMRRLTEEGQARLVAGSVFPSTKDWPKGRVRLSFSDPTLLSPRYADQLENLAPTGVVGVVASQDNPIARAVAQNQ